MEKCFTYQFTNQVAWAYTYMGGTVANFSFINLNSRDNYFRLDLDICFN
jgi:hypothetical protein